MPAIEIDSIIVNRNHRIRREVSDAAVASLAESISRIGLINAITISQDNVLIAGETRLSAAKLLGWTHIEYRHFEDLDELSKLAIELEENVKRTDLPWQDQCDALKRFHDLQKANDPNWRQEDTAKAIGYSRNTVTEQLAVAEQVASGNARVADALKYSTARELTKRINERKASDDNAKILSIEGAPKKATSPIINHDFHAWSDAYKGPPFNVLHIDFPYGINSNANAKHKQFAAKSFGGYDDSPEAAMALRNTLFRNRYRLLGESAHLIFWFSMHNYSETLEFLRSWLWVDPFPLIWHKTQGIIPNPNLNPRRCYETAFLCSWPKDNPRKIIAATSNIYQATVTRDAEHMSEKSVDMLTHFFRMLVDSNTRLLDPTCGSGSSLVAAKNLGAQSVLGLELDKEFCELAQLRWEKASV